MEYHFIKYDNNKNILYFPQSNRFYKFNDKGKSLIFDMFNDIDKDKILEKYNIAEEEYKKYFDNIIKQNQITRLENKNNANQCNNHKILGRLVIHITNYCNLKCKYCYANGGNYNSIEKDIDISTIDKILEVFYNEFDYINSIQIFGGEPLLNLNAFEYICEKIRIIDLNKNTNTIIGTVTNGTMINDKFINIVKKYNVQVVLSYDGAKVINDILRISKDGTSTSDLVLANAKKLKEQTGQPFMIEATYTATHINNNISIQDTVKGALSELSDVIIHLTPVAGADENEYSISNYKIFADSVDEVFDTMSEGDGFIYSLVERIINGLSVKDREYAYICDAGTGTLSVSVEGDIYPCFMFTDMEKLKLGNVYDNNVLQSENFKNIIDKFQNFSNKKNNSKCKECFIRTLCSSCLGLNNFGTDNPFELDEKICSMFQSMVERVLINLSFRHEQNMNESLERNL